MPNVIDWTEKKAPCLEKRLNAGDVGLLKRQVGAGQPREGAFDFLQPRGFLFPAA